MNSRIRNNIKVLVFFQDANHYHTIDYLCANLSEIGIDASSFNIATWRFRGSMRKKISFWVSLLCLLARIPKIRGLITNIFRDKAMLKMSEYFDIIDIHFFSPVYDKIIEELKSRGRKIKITIWGSDFYRVDRARREKQRMVYGLVDIIQLETKQIADDFTNVYPEYKNKIRLAHFGIIQFDIIDKLLIDRDQIFYKMKMKLPVDKLLVTCGTNGSVGHQHEILLKCIDSLPAVQKEQLFLIIPMTYGGSKSYVRTIKQKVASIGCPYLILTEFLSLNELCKYRIVSDILITIQKTDALASAVQEHLYTEDVLIAGDWLPYGALSDHGIFFLTSSIESLTDQISYVNQQYDSFKGKCSENRLILSEFSSWQKVITYWKDIYTELSSNKSLI